MSTQTQPMQLQLPTHSNAGDHLEVINHLQSGGYEVAKEFANDNIAVYNIYPKPDRDVPANRKPPSLRGECD